MNLLFALKHRLDYTLVFGVLSLAFLGLLTLWGLSRNVPEIRPLVEKQAAFVVLGTMLMAGLAMLDWRMLRVRSLPTLLPYLVSTALLLGVLIFGVRIRGAASWFHFGAFTVEPIEAVKLGVLLILAKYFSLRHRELVHPKHIFISGFYVGIPILITLMQPDLGAAVVLGFLWIGVLILSGIPLRHLVTIALLIVFVSGVAWQSGLADYQKDRLRAFLSPHEDSLGAGYQVHQALIAIGSGGVFGKGFAQGDQASLAFLPESATDFIFAALAEQFGFLGVAILLAAFLLIFWRVLRMAMYAEHNYLRIFASGIALFLFIQVVMNVGMNVGLLPVTGITLPFVSYGGSSLLIFFASLGILQGIRVSGRSVVETEASSFSPYE